MRERIVFAASDILAERGLGGLTLAETGERVGLKVTSITHYFKRRDDLVAACFDQALDRYVELVELAEANTDPSSRIKSYIHAHAAVAQAAASGSARSIPTLSGIATLGPLHRQRLVDRYRSLFRRVRTMLGNNAAADKDLLNARAHVLLEILFWLPNAMLGYPLENFDRFADHVFRILHHGLAGKSQRWSPVIFPVTMPVEPKGLRDLIKAATTLVNDEGYKGASINKVVGLLDLTKGSFYHHLESRDELTLQCFSASYNTILQAQRTGEALDSSNWVRLCSVVASLVSYQFSADGPLLRTTALQGLPKALRDDVIRQSDIVARGFADIVTDCMVEGSANPVDALIAGQLIMATINAAYVMNNWSQRRPSETAVQWYASTIVNGLFAPLSDAG